MKGSLSIKTVAMIMLGLAVVALVYASVTGWFDVLVENFIGAVDYEQVS